MRKAKKGRFFQAGFFCGPHIFYAPAVIAAGGRPHGGRGFIAPSARIRPAHHPQKNEGKQGRPPVSQPPNRLTRIHTGARQSPDEKGRPENKPIRLPSGHHPLSTRHPRHQSPSRNQSRRASMQLSLSRSHPGCKAGSMLQAQPVNLLEAGKNQPAKSHTPPHPRPSSSPVKNSHAGVAVQPERPVTIPRERTGALRPLQGVLPCLVGFVAPNALQFR